MSRGQEGAARRLLRCCHGATLCTVLPADPNQTPGPEAGADGDGEGPAEPPQSTKTVWDPTGGPYAAWVSVATDHAGAPLLLLSTLAVHTRAVMADPRVALLVHPLSTGLTHDAQTPPVNPQEEDRVTLMGRLDRDSDPAHRERFLARHPYAALYADFADFALWRMTLGAAHRVSGFGAATWVDDPAVLLVAPSVAAALAEAEPALLTHLATDHPGLADRLARACLGPDAASGGVPWQISALDADGLDLAPGPEAEPHDFSTRVRRVAFNRPVEDPAAVVPAVLALAHEAGA